MVGYDSIIPPGRVGLVTESVNLSNYHAGSYTKSATITSNAKNAPSMQISIRWIIKSYVDVSPPSIQLAKDKDGVFQTEITVSSEKANLKISEITFKATDDRPSPESPAWQKDLPILLAFVMEKDTLKQDGMHAYKYKLSAKIAGLHNKNGEFIIKTNHPEAPEVKINGMFN